jgi:hypothetical protein
VKIYNSLYLEIDVFSIATFDCRMADEFTNSLRALFEVWFWGMPPN